MALRIIWQLNKHQLINEYLNLCVWTRKVGYGEGYDQKSQVLAGDFSLCAVDLIWLKSMAQFFTPLSQYLQALFIGCIWGNYPHSPPLEVFEAWLVKEVFQTAQCLAAPQR